PLWRRIPPVLSHLECDRKRRRAPLAASPKKRKTISEQEQEGIFRIACSGGGSATYCLPMNSCESPALPCRVASLHLHPPEPRTPLQSVESVELVEGKGILDEPRYFNRKRKDGQPN